MATIEGTKGDDRLDGTNGADVIVGKAGDDRLSGGAGDDILRPDTGRDAAFGGGGDDRVIVSEFGEASPDSFDGGGGRDMLDLSKLAPLNYPITWDYDAATDSYVVERFGQPSSLAFTGVEAIVATGEQDTFDFYDSVDGFVIDAGGGDDRVSAGDGDDELHGSFGDDTLGGGGGRNLLYGGKGDDLLFIGFGGYGLMDGGAGRDTGEFAGKVDLAAGYALSDEGRRIQLVGIEDIKADFFKEGASARGDDHANLISAENARYGGALLGGGGGDTLIGGEFDDRLLGEDGADTLTGGLGADLLTGGGGADVFRFADDFFGRPDAVDTVRDFTRAQQDRIDLTGVDADARTEGIDAFSFIGTDAFTARAGELRYAVSGGDTHVQADTDGDGRADLRFDLTGEFRLAAGDFMLRSDAAPHLHAPFTTIDVAV